MPATSVPPGLPEIAAAFPLSGRLLSARLHGNGHINETYVAVFAEAAGTRRYIFQKLNHRILKNVPALMENIARVTAHVSAQHPRAMVLVPTHNGRVVHQDATGNWWRLYDFIEGTHTVERVTSDTRAREAARAFGEYQALLEDLPGARLHETIPNFHHTRSRFEALRHAVGEDPLGRAAGVRRERHRRAPRTASAPRITIPRSITLCSTTSRAAPLL